MIRRIVPPSNRSADHGNLPAVLATSAFRLAVKEQGVAAKTGAGGAVGTISRARCIREAPAGGQRRTGSKHLDLAEGLAHDAGIRGARGAVASRPPGSASLADIGGWRDAAGAACFHPARTPGRPFEAGTIAAGTIAERVLAVRPPVRRTKA